MKDSLAAMTGTVVTRVRRGVRSTGAGAEVGTGVGGKPEFPSLEVGELDKFSQDDI